jgi:hypothetical protein
MCLIWGGQLRAEGYDFAWLPLLPCCQAVKHVLAAVVLVALLLWCTADKQQAQPAFE